MAKISDKSASVFPRRPKTVYIVEHETERGIECRACPPAIVLAGGDTLQLVNMTGIAWVLRIWGSPSGLAASLEVGPNATTRVGTLPNSVPLQSYDYTLTSLKGSIQVKGFSDPMIIIDPNG